MSLNKGEGLKMSNDHHNTVKYRSPELVRQAEIIEQKKQEILRRLEEKKRNKGENKGSEITEKVIEPVKRSLPPVCNSVGANVFKNDGSFLEQFKKMQESQAGKLESSSKSKATGIVLKIQPQSNKTLDPTPAQLQLVQEEENEKHDAR